MYAFFTLILALPAIVDARPVSDYERDAEMHVQTVLLVILVILVSINLNWTRKIGFVIKAPLEFRRMIDTISAKFGCCTKLIHAVFGCWCCLSQPWAAVYQYDLGADRTREGYLDADERTRLNAPMDADKPAA